MWQYRSQNELYHHGVLGMKWHEHHATGSEGSGKSEKNVEKEQRKAEHKKFRADVKQAKRKGLTTDFHLDPDNGSVHIDQVYDSNNQKIGKEYANKVMTQATREKGISMLIGTVGVIAGANIAGALLSKM